MSLRYFKMHLKIFLEALFLELLELFRISKIHCRQILRNFELKLSHIKIRGSDYMVCNFFLDPTSRWFFKRGLAFPTRHTVSTSLWSLKWGGHDLKKKKKKKLSIEDCSRTTNGFISAHRHLLQTSKKCTEQPHCTLGLGYHNIPIIEVFFILLNATAELRVRIVQPFFCAYYFTHR